MSALLRYSMSLPVTSAVVGMPRLDMLAHNVEVASAFSPLGESEMHRMRHDLMPSREGLEHKLVGHLDGPTMNPEIFAAWKVAVHQRRNISNVFYGLNSLEFTDTGGKRCLPCILTTPSKPLGGRSV